jgi:hypothetical protein
VLQSPEFKNANNGAAVAFVGATTESHMALLVGSCTSAVSAVLGQIFVGVNDSDVTNNHGSVSFAARVGLPTLEQWRSGGAFECARQPRRVLQDSIPVPAATAATDLPDSLNPALITEGLAAARDEIRGCRSQSPARGMVKLAVSVSPDGRVTNVSIEAAPDRTLALCAAAAVQHAMFSPTRSGGAFAYPFVF